MKNQNKNIVVYIILFFLITILIIINGFFLWQNSRLETIQYKSHKKVSDFSNQTTQPQEENNKQDISKQQDENILEEKPYFTNLSEDLLKKDNSIKLVPNDGFFITTSIVSNKKDKIVYAEISESVKEDSLYLNCEYSIFTKDLTTDKITKIYSHLSEVYDPLVYFPIAWSKNDKKIILEWGNPIRVGSGGVPYYETFTIDPMGGEISTLATDASLFIDDYNKVVYVGESENSPSTCSPDENNRGVIILKEIESGQQKILAEEENSYYVLKNIDEDFNLTYTIKKVINVDRCSEFDELTPEKSLTLKIK